MENKLRNYTIHLIKFPEEKNTGNEGETIIEEVVAENVPEWRYDTCSWFASMEYQGREIKLNPHLDTLQ